VQRFPARTLALLYETLLGGESVPELADVSDDLDCIECEGCSLRYFRPVIEGSPRLYERLQTFPWYYEKLKPEFDVVAAHLPAAGRILEIGCGAAHFREFVVGCDYVGLETNPAAVALARGRGIDVRAERIESHVDGAAGTYDAAVAFQVLEHVADPRSFLLATARCVRPGGVVAVSVPSFDGYLNQARNYALNLPPHHQTLWPDRALRTVAGVIGARLESLAREPLRAMHFDDYRRVRIENLLDRVRWAGRRLVDVSRGATICSAAAAFLARVQPWPRPRCGIAGHTATAVYRVDADR
jgi:SAM-dependent methyltransferase